MAGTLVANTINTDTGVYTSLNALNGAAKAWGSYAFVASGSIPTLNSAFNISSITRNATGNYTFAFTTALSNANYVVVGTPLYPSGLQSMNINSGTKSTSSVQIYTVYTNGTGGAAAAYDYGIDFAIFGA
jgi:hypothetical protein